MKPWPRPTTPRPTSTRLLAPVLADVRDCRIEDKGASVAVHVRGVPRALRAEVWPAADAAAEPWLRSGALRGLVGADVHEYLPAAGWTKGDAVRWIAHDVERRTGQTPWVAYFGDDLTDEDAFRAVERARSSSAAAPRRPLPPRGAVRRRDGAGRSRGVDDHGGRVVTAAALSMNVAERLGDTRLIVVANREPYIHLKDVRTPGFVGRLVGRKPRTRHATGCSRPAAWSPRSIR